MQSTFTLPKAWQQDWIGILAQPTVIDIRQFVAMRLWMDISTGPMLQDTSSQSDFSQIGSSTQAQFFADSVTSTPNRTPLEILASMFSKDYGDQAQIRYRFLTLLSKRYQLELALNPHMAHQAPAIANNCFELWQCIPIRSSNDCLVIGTCEPYTLWLWSHLLESMVSKPVKLQLIDSSNLSQLQHIARSVHAYIHEDTSKIIDLSLPAREYRLDQDQPHNASSIIEMCRWLLIESITHEVSDLHLECKENGIYVKERRDGVLDQVFILRRGTGQMLISRIKLLAGLDITEQRKPQDGRISVLFEQERQEIRASSIPTIYGEKIVLRFFDPKLLHRELSDLGMNMQIYTHWKKLLSRESGMLLSVGPTGSGKTSTLYASLRSLLDTQRNICTVEDPVEILHPSLNQLQVHPQIGISFAVALKHMLRQDPDVIMIGEIRDSETAKTAIQASLTGHLVLASLHATDALGAVYRLKELGIASYLLHNTLSGILAQRLVRTLCTACGGKIQQTICLHCNNAGYSGRTGIFELLPVNDKIIEQLETLPATKLRKILQQNKHINLFHQGQALVANKVTTIEEVIRVCPTESEQVSY